MNKFNFSFHKNPCSNFHHYGGGSYEKVALRI